METLESTPRRNVYFLHDNARAYKRDSTFEQKNNNNFLLDRNPRSVYYFYRTPECSKRMFLSSSMKIRLEFFTRFREKHADVTRRDFSVAVRGRTKAASVLPVAVGYFNPPARFQSESGRCSGVFFAQRGK